MSTGLDVEALLDKTAKKQNGHDTSARPDEGRLSNGHRDRRSGGDPTPLAESRRSRNRSPSPYRRREGDHYRRGYRRSRSRSPYRDNGRYSHPNSRRDDYGRSHNYGAHERNGRIGTKGGRPSRSPEMDADSDKRTVFVQQVAARATESMLMDFFKTAGRVVNARLVKDKGGRSDRHKGVAYVEFNNESAVAKAIDMTGQKLVGIPVIVQLTEAEKNRQARETTGTGASAVPFHRIYLANLHFSITDEDIHKVFKSFGELELVKLEPADEESLAREGQKTKGHGVIQYRDPAIVPSVVTGMKGFELGGRAIRLGLGSENFTESSTQKCLDRFPSSLAQLQAHKSTAAANSARLERGGRRGKDQGHSTALDDAETMGVNYGSVDRHDLMRKLDHQEQANGHGNETTSTTQAAKKARAMPPPQVASRCLCIRNAFDPAEETEPNWVDEMKKDVEEECQSSFGKVVHIAVDPNSAGDIYVKFAEVSGGEKAMQGLNGRFFNQRRLTVDPMVEPVYRSMHPKSG